VNSWYPRITVHSLAILISVLTYVLTTRVEHERRPPSIAIAWVLGMLALPYVALPMYLLFGRRKLPRRVVRPMPSPSHSSHWAADLIESFDVPAAAPARIRLHRDGAESAAALFELIRGAQRQLDLCTYILGNDEFGHLAVRHLMERAEAGVRVRLMIDGVGAMQMPRTQFQRMQQAGIETAIFSPLLARRTQGPRNLRNHRKLTIADGTRLWAGGRNIAAEYFMGSAKMAAWGDLSYDLDGHVAHAAATQFEWDWVAAGGKPGLLPPPDPARTSTAPGGEDAFAQFLPSGPDQTEDTVHALLIDGCFQAQERIIAVTPYFVPDASFEAALRLAARRGVRIDLFIPNRSNHRLADFVRNRSLRALAKVGVRIHLLPRMNHAKAVVFDRSLALSGSVNLDSRSLLLNYECAVVFYGTREIDWLAQWIDALTAESRSFDQKPANLLRDICEGLLLTVAFQL
jgi:cardiolipin synthase